MNKKRERVVKWTPIPRRTSSSATPVPTAPGPSGSPGNWNTKASQSSSRPGIFDRAATLCWICTSPLQKPNEPSLSFPPTTLPPSTHSLSGLPLLPRTRQVQVPSCYLYVYMNVNPPASSKPLSTLTLLDWMSQQRVKGCSQG